MQKLAALQSSKDSSSACHLKAYDDDPFRVENCYELFTCAPSLVLLSFMNMEGV